MAANTKRQISIQYVLNPRPEFPRPRSGTLNPKRPNRYKNKSELKAQREADAKNGGAFDPKALGLLDLEKRPGRLTKRACFHFVFQFNRHSFSVAE
jgi:hypothetical protein